MFVKRCLNNGGILVGIFLYAGQQFGWGIILPVALQPGFKNIFGTRINMP